MNEPDDNGSAGAAYGGFPMTGMTGKSPSEFDVKLIAGGVRVVDVMRIIRHYTGKGMQEAVALARGGGVIKSMVARPEAYKIASELRGVGAIVELVETDWDY